MKPSSLDFRERVISMVQEGEFSQAQIAEHFHISLGTVENWWRLWRETGSLAPQPSAGGAKRTLESCEAVIRAAVKHLPDATLEELCAHVQATAGISANPSMMCQQTPAFEFIAKKSHSTTANATRRACKNCGETFKSTSWNLCAASPHI